MPPNDPVIRKTWALSKEPTPAPVHDLELFASATHSEEGYLKWRAESAQERQAGLLPELADESGYAAWKSDQLAQRATFEKQWGIRLGHPVRIQLRGEPREREGLILLVDDLPPSPSRQPLRLRIGDHLFLPIQIESLVTLDP